MFKSKTFECSTGTILTPINPLDMTQDKIQELKAEENFIVRLKKQKQKMEILNSEFQQQDTLITEQEHLIKTLTASNNQLKSNLDEFAQKVQVLEMENTQKSQIIYTLEATIDKLTHDLTRVNEAYGMQKILVRDGQEKLHQQQNAFSKNYNSLKETTKVVEKQASVLKQKYHQKSDQAKELVKSLQLAEKTIVKLHQKVKKFELQNQHLVQKYQQNMDQSSKQIHTLKLQNDSFRTKTAIQTKQINDLQHSCNSMSKQIEDLTTLSEQKQTKASKLQDHLRNTLDQIKILEQDINDRDHLINDLSMKKQSNNKYRAMKRQLISIRDREALELDELIESVKQRHL